MLDSKRPRVRIAEQELWRTWPGRDRRIPRPSDRSYLIHRTQLDELRRLLAGPHLRDRRDLRILDLGCKDAPYFPLFKPFAGQFVGLDWRYVARLPGVQADAALLPFPDETFDLVLCTHLVTGIPRPGVAMAEIRRALRPGGLAIIAAHGMWPVDGYYYRFAEAGLRVLFADAQLEIVEIEPHTGSIVTLLQTLNEAYASIAAYPPLTWTRPLVYSANNILGDLAQRCLGKRPRHLMPLTFTCLLRRGNS